MIDYSVRGAWDRCNENWTDPARHDEMFKLLVQHDCYAWGCARYREKGDDPIAKQQLERLSKAAVAAMFARQTTREVKGKTPYKNLMIVLVALLAAMLLAMCVTKSLHDNQPRQAPKPTRH